MNHEVLCPSLTLLMSVSSSLCLSLPGPLTAHPCGRTTTSVHILRQLGLLPVAMPCCSCAEDALGTAPSSFTEHPLSAHFVCLSPKPGEGPILAHPLFWLLPHQVQPTPHYCSVVLLFAPHTSSLCLIPRPPTAGTPSLSPSILWARAVLCPLLVTKMLIASCILPSGPTAGMFMLQLCLPGAMDFLTSTQNAGKPLNPRVLRCLVFVG